jgi:hypothetical protein
MDDVNRREFLKLAAAGAAIGPVASTAAPTGSDDICFQSARELATLIRTRKLSARDVMAAHLDQTSRLNPKINAG